MATTTRPTLLNLETLQPHVVRIDGQPYDLMTSGELSILEHAHLRRHAPRFDALFSQQDRLTDEEALELAACALAICQVVLKAPPAVIEALTDMQRVEVCLTFTLLSLGISRPTSESRPAAGTPTTQGRSTGASRSRASRASSEGRRRRG